MKIVKVWDGVESINGVPAKEVLANRDDLARALGDIFLVLVNGNVTQIEIGSTIKSIYNLDENLSIEEVANAYLVKKEEEEAREMEYQIVNEELQEQVALLSYEVMKLQEEQSPKFKMIKIWFRKGFWTRTMVEKAVIKGWITEEECTEVLN